MGGGGDGAYRRVTSAVREHRWQRPRPGIDVSLRSAALQVSHLPVQQARMWMGMAATHDSLGERGALGTDADRIGRILDVCAADPAAVRTQDGAPDAEVRVGAWVAGQHCGGRGEGVGGGGCGGGQGGEDSMRGLLRPECVWPAPLVLVGTGRAAGLEPLRVYAVVLRSGGGGVGWWSVRGKRCALNRRGDRHSAKTTERWPVKRCCLR